MACHLPPSTRDVLVRLFRAEVYRRTEFVEFPHQAEFRLATEGMRLTKQVVSPPDAEPKSFDPEKITPDDYALRPIPVKLLVTCAADASGAYEVGETGNYARYEWRLAVPRTYTTIGPRGIQIHTGVIARRAAELASFKAGKSRDIGMWATGFACLPGASIDMLGLTYETSEHEFTYLCDALLSGTKPLIRKTTHYYNDVRQGRMYLELPNGCSFGVRSWKNKDALRGGQITCYIFNEIYQLPGLQVYTGHAQNLRAERGFAVFTSTPDRPWVKILHQMGHGHHPNWACVCGIDAFSNPYTWDIQGFMQDCPDWETIELNAPHLLSMCQQSGAEPGALMSREKFMISWLGQLGGFVGRVYSFNREQVTCYPHTHPHIYKPDVVAEWKQQRQYIESLRGHA